MPDWIYEDQRREQEFVNSMGMLTGIDLPTDGCWEITRSACFSEEDASHSEEGHGYGQEALRAIVEGWEMNKLESYTSVWDAIADTPGQSANLRARAELMQQIAALVKRQDWTQVEAANRCGVTQPRINDLLRGRVSRFSLDALVNISTALGCRVRVDIDAA
jgi:predicted XRE-type DNA-binding protein